MIKQLAQQARRVYAAMAGSEAASRRFGRLARRQLGRLIADPVPTLAEPSVLADYVPFVAQLAATRIGPAEEYLDEIRGQCRGEPAVRAELARLIDLASAGGEREDATGWRFFELFLAEYLPGVRRDRGVYFTPPELVAFMVRGARQIAATQIDAAAKLRIVDPACGTGAFLIESARQFGGTRRPVDLAGFELLPAAAATAALELATHGPQVPQQIVCGSALEDEQLARPVMTADALVVIGNPPYANFGRQNRHPWILDLLNEYKQGLNERKLNLDDDYIKFMRWSQVWIDRCGCGVMAFVTNSRYLSGLVHRRMRQSLLASFDRVYVLDLGGQANTRRHGKARDDNLFGIRQGVAVGFFVKSSSRADRDCARTISYRRLTGTRDAKLTELATARIDELPWTTLAADSPHDAWVPRRRPIGQYDRFTRLDDVFDQYVSGVQTKRDALFVDRRPADLEVKIHRHLQAAGSDVTFRRECIQPYRVSPMDVQWVYYEPRLIGRARFALLQHMLRPNLALVFMRQSTNSGEYDHFLATDCLASDRVFYSGCGAPFVAPLWLDGHSNIRPEFLARFAESIGSRPSDRRAAPRDSVSPLDLFHYMYAVFHSTRFRGRHAESLRIDFPRVPLPRSREAYGPYRRLGRQLVRQHTAERREPASIRFPVDGDRFIAAGYPRFVPARHSSDSPRGCLWVNRRQYFTGISRAMWEFRMGGYPVLSRWLKRRGRSPLDQQEIATFACVAGRVAKTLRIVQRIDALGDP